MRGWGGGLTGASRRLWLRPLGLLDGVEGDWEGWGGGVTG